MDDGRARRHGAAHTPAVAVTMNFSAGVERFMRARNLLTLSLMAAVLPFACRGDGPVAPEGCTEELDGACWTLLGLDAEWVTEIAVTPWGVFVGTLDHGIFRLDADRRWSALGPELWYDHLIPKTLL